MSNSNDKPLVLGRVSGFRGSNGEITVRVVSGDAGRWVHLRRVVVNGAGGEKTSASRRVDGARAYRDRLVLKLEGVDDANTAAGLRGSEIVVPGEELPALPQGVHWVERLVGAQVLDRASGALGRVVDVVDTGGIDLLLVKDARGVETLVPLAKEIVTEIDESSGTILVAIPDGLRGLNSPGGRETA